MVTTDSKHGRKIYPSLAREMVLTNVDQLRIPRITYIRLREEFVYLAVILGALAWRAPGWALDGTLEDKLTLAAPHIALSQRRAARADSSFRPWLAVRQQRLHGLALSPT